MSQDREDDMSEAAGSDCAGDAEQTKRTTHHFSVPVPGPFDRVIGRFEALVAAYLPNEYAALLARGASYAGWAKRSASRSGS